MPRPTSPASGHCSDCGPVSRREFMRTTTGALGALGVVGLPGVVTAAESAAPKGATSETLVAQLYGSLSEAQRQAICFPFDHDLRLKVDNNWQITPKSLSELLTKDQQALVKDIFMGIHSDEYA